jgi:altronate hydrolase
MNEHVIQPQGKTLVLNAADNIAVALANLDVGAETPEGVTIVRRVPRGHKFATRAIAAGEAVLKFGQIIGFAKEGIAPGDWVHEHNCGMGGPDGTLSHDYAFAEGAVPVAFVPQGQRATFQGYKRANGDVGTRNYIGILTSVNCSATVAKFMASSTTTRKSTASFPSCTAPAAPWTRMARATRSCGGRSGAIRPIPIWAPRCWWDSDARPSRSIG